MIDFFENLPPYLQALIAGIITWLLTALGAASVFIFKTVNKKILTSMQGFAAGIMIAASFWSLLQPSIDYGTNGHLPAWLPAAIGFILGGVFIRGLDAVIPHIHQKIGDKSQYREGVKTSLSKNALLVLAITLHNIPEGLSIGRSIWWNCNWKWTSYLFWSPWFSNWYWYSEYSRRSCFVHAD